MTPQLIAIDPGALDTLIAEVKALRQDVQAVQMTPAPEWLTVQKYAARVRRSSATVNRWIAAGKVEIRVEGNVRMVRA